jgi:hypothetical protein
MVILDRKADEHLSGFQYFVVRLDEQKRNKKLFRKYLKCFFVCPWIFQHCEALSLQSEHSMACHGISCHLLRGHYRSLYLQLAPFPSSSSTDQATSTFRLCFNHTDLGLILLYMI